MIENLMNLVQGFSQQAVAGESAIPSEQKGAVTQVIASSLVDGLMSEFSKGNITGLMDIFSKKTTTTGSPVMNGIQGYVVSMISQKTGISPAIAGGIASAVVPMIMNSLGQKAADPNDKALDFNGLFQSLAGGNLGGLDVNSLMNRLDDDNDGFGLDDVVRLVSNNKGGIMGALGSLFGK